MSDIIEVLSETSKGIIAVSNVKRVAERVIAVHRKMYEESPTNMKLQKLCYYAQGFFLGETHGHPLFSEDFEAWALGPVCRELYEQYRKYRYHGIDAEVDETPLDSSLEEHIEAIVSAYGRLDGAALSTMTHKEEPWIAARGNTPEGGNSDTVISKTSMQTFFEKVLSEANQ